MINVPENERPHSFIMTLVLLSICSSYLLSSFFPPLLPDPPPTTSEDGVPFLMHDRMLRRTTDVGKVFPDRQTEEASFFNWTDLQQLNAGQWFLKVPLVCCRGFGGLFVKLLV